MMGRAIIHAMSATIEIVIISFAFMPLSKSETEAAAPVRAFCIA